MSYDDAPTCVAHPQRRRRQFGRITLILVVLGMVLIYPVVLIKTGVLDANPESGILIAMVTALVLLALRAAQRVLGLLDKTPSKGPKTSGEGR